MIPTAPSSWRRCADCRSKGRSVPKRFNATGCHLAEHGGACPRLGVQTSCRTPGKIVPPFVESKPTPGAVFLL
ncbi:MAG: hypothetical protein C0427_00195 [Rhodobacter sp.]|nr:hypothetical protein [Rhodobacter sp.]